MKASKNLLLTLIALLGTADVCAADTSLLTPHQVKEILRCEQLESCEPIKEILNDPGKPRSMLLDGLKSPHDGVRFWCAGGLALDRETDATGPLIATLKDENPAVIGAAAFALGERKIMEAKIPLETLLKHSRPEIRIAALIALAKLDTVSSAETILPLLQDVEPEIRGYAALTLAQLGAQGSKKQMIQLLLDSDAQVRALTIEAIADLGFREAGDTIIKLLDDDEWKVRSAAIFGLTRLRFATKETEEKLTSLQHTDDVEEVRNAAGVALKKLFSSIP